MKSIVFGNIFIIEYLLGKPVSLIVFILNILDKKIYFPLEGYLLPDTYVFEHEDVNVKNIFNVILNFTEKYLDTFKEDCNYAVGLGYNGHCRNLSKKEINDRLSGNIAGAIYGINKGARFLRVHNVGAHIDAINMYNAINQI